MSFARARSRPIACCVLLAALAGCETADDDGESTIGTGSATTAPAATPAPAAPPPASGPILTSPMTPAEAQDEERQELRELDFADQDAGAEHDLPSSRLPGDPECSEGACREQASCYERSGLACRCWESVSPPACGTLDLHGLAGPDDTLGWIAAAISRDGKVVVGRGSLADRAVAWSKASGTRVAPTPEGELPEAVASADEGSVILVNAWLHGGEPDAHSYLWKDMGEELEPIDLAQTGCLADVSADGSVVVGTVASPEPTSTAVRWTRASGLVELGAAPSAALATNADGTRVLLSLSGWSARWTAAEGAQPVPDAVANVAFGDLSDDGSVLIGQYVPVPNAGQKLVRWRGAELEELGALEGGPPDSAIFSWVTGVSADGSVVVGKSGDQAMIWTEATGMRALRDVLALQGVDVGAWALDSAVGVSADGKVIAGNGLCEGRAVPFVAHLP